MPVTVKCYGWRCMPGSILSQWCPLTHAFLGMDSEQDHCKMRVFVLTRRTREGPSNRPPFFFLLRLSPSVLPDHLSLTFSFFFFFKSSSHCANRRWQTMLLTFSSPAVSLLPILYRLFLFMVSIYGNSSKKHRETSFSSLVFFHPILALKRKFSFSKSSFTKWWITRSINWYN